VKVFYGALLIVLVAVPMALGVLTARAGGRSEIVDRS